MSNCHNTGTQPPRVQVEKEAVEVATDAQRGGDNLCGEDQASHDNENIEEVVCFPTSEKKQFKKKNGRMEKSTRTFQEILRILDNLVRFAIFLSEVTSEI